MLRRLHLRDVAIVAELEVELGPGFTVLTGETGAGKSILIDALQFALGQRADVLLVREGAARAEVSVEFDTPPGLRDWLLAGGYTLDDSLLLRRVLDAQGRSRAWINGSPAPLAHLREAAEHLVDIHGQHAWQRLGRPAAERALLDEQAGLPAQPLRSAWQQWQEARTRLAEAQARREQSGREQERLAWQIAEVDKLAPQDGEWDALNAEHQRLSHSQALLDGAQAAQMALNDDERGAAGAAARALSALRAVQTYDTALADVAAVLQSAQDQIADAERSLSAYLRHAEPDPERLAALDARLADWVALARRYRCTPAGLPSRRVDWAAQLRTLLDATDLEALGAAAEHAQRAWQAQAEAVSDRRRQAAPGLAAAVTQAMQTLGMAGGRFEVALLPQTEPQSWGLEGVELRVAGHAGSSARPLARVASGGELSRLALAIAVSTAGPGSSPEGVCADASSPATLIFDEIDAGIGGTVADSVGRLLKQLGRHAQVLAITHLAQVAACGDAHHVVSKSQHEGHTRSQLQPVQGQERVAEIARMLGGERSSAMQHAQTLLTPSTLARNAP